MAQQQVTDAEIAQWAALYRADYSLHEIADGARRSVETVWRHLKGVTPLRARHEKSKSALVRFNSKWRLDDSRGCWLWTKGKMKAGYGCFKWRGESYAHRVSYLLHAGEIPDGLHVLHECDTPACVNPKHLFLGTQADNMADCSAKGRARRAQSYRTHCPKGHPYSGDNLSLTKKGFRRCKTCARLRFHARKNGE